MIETTFTMTAADRPKSSQLLLLCASVSAAAAAAGGVAVPGWKLGPLDYAIAPNGGLGPRGRGRSGGIKTLQPALLCQGFSTCLQKEAERPAALMSGVLSRQWSGLQLHCMTPARAVRPARTGRDTRGSCGVGRRGGRQRGRGLVGGAQRKVSHSWVGPTGAPSF